MPRLKLSFLECTVGVLSKCTDIVNMNTGPDIYMCKMVIILLSMSKKHVLDAQKNRLIETVLLSTHNIILVEK